MKFGLIAIAISVLCLIGSLVVNLPGWVNIVGLLSGVAGLVLLGRAKKGGGA